MGGCSVLGLSWVLFCYEVYSMERIHEKDSHRGRDPLAALSRCGVAHVSAGYHFGAVTPYATYARVKANSSTSTPGLDAAAVPPYRQGTVMFLNSILNATLRDLAVQHTISVGGRWDFMKNVDAKLQFDHTNLGSDSAGTLRNIAPGFRPGSAVNIFSACVDFVF